ncbi:MAG: V-type ATPase subunit [Nitrosopumilales archaeon]|nr:V-type ATPase subunit [Nitrosopumilales archaeon]
MGTSQYSSSFGRLQSISVNFLSKEFIQNLLKTNDVNEMIKMLESTWYGQEIKKAASVYQGSELLEVALNRHLVEVNKNLLEATPFSGKNAVRAYLSKWDNYNIELILSSKSMGRTITETESLLISSRNVPAGISAGNIPHDEMKIILAESGVEGVVNKLAKYGYGVILMQHLDAYQKTGDFAPMMSALHSAYYQKLLESLKFFQGDEGIIRELIRTEIDKKNILSLLKAKESDLDKEMVGRHLVEGGNISTKELLEIYGVKNVTEIIGRIEARFKLAKALEQYKTTNSLIDFEIAIAKFINTTYVNKLKNIALSIGTIFYFIFNAENEHENLKRITYGKRYNLSNERISSMLLI